MIACTLETDTLEEKLLCKFDLDPGSLVVFSMPLVPLLLARTEQVLWVAANSVMFGCDSG